MALPLILSMFLSIAYDDDNDDDDVSYHSLIRIQWQYIILYSICTTFMSASVGMH